MTFPKVCGIQVDAQTRCAHYHSPSDIIAIKMKCCYTYYACKECHDALADHALEQWRPEEQTHRAVLCGTCGSELTIAEYLEGADCCPVCGAPFNPGCRRHHGYYFE